MFTIKNPLAKKDFKSYNSRQCQRKRQGEHIPQSLLHRVTAPPPPQHTTLNNKKRFLYGMDLAPSSMVSETERQPWHQGRLATRMEILLVSSEVKHPWHEAWGIQALEGGRSNRSGHLVHSVRCLFRQSVHQQWDWSCTLVWVLPGKSLPEEPLTSTMRPRFKFKNLLQGLSMWLRG